MDVTELEGGGYRITLDGWVNFVPTFFLSRSARPEGGTFHLVIFDLPDGSEEGDTAEFRMVSERGRRLDFFGEVVDGTLRVSNQSL